MAPVNLNMQDAGYLLLHWYDSNNDACSKVKVEKVTLKDAMPH